MAYKLTDLDYISTELEKAVDHYGGTYGIDPNNINRALHDAARNFRFDPLNIKLDQNPYNWGTLMLNDREMMLDYFDDIDENYSTLVAFCESYLSLVVGY